MKDVIFDILWENSGHRILPACHPPKMGFESLLTASMVNTLVNYVCELFGPAFSRGVYRAFSLEYTEHKPQKCVWIWPVAIVTTAFKCECLC